MSKRKRQEIAEEEIILNFANANGYDATNIEDLRNMWEQSIEGDTGINSKKLIDYLLSDGAEILHTIAK